jgi:hypothetical protein
VATNLENFQLEYCEAKKPVKLRNKAKKGPQGVGDGFSQNPLSRGEETPKPFSVLF